VIIAIFIAALAGGVPAIGLDEHVGAQLPLDLPFTTSDDVPEQLSAVFDRTHPVVMVLAYARCEMLCSVVLHGVADAVRASHLTAGTDYRIAIVSLDSTETPGEAGRRAAHLGYPATYLVGDSVRPLAASLGFRYAWDEQTHQYAHPVVVFVLTPDGHIAEYLRGVTFPGFDAALGRATRGETTPSTAQDLISCFHFDPSLRRYGPAVQLFLRLGAGVVLAALLGMVAALIGWERRRSR
jgi:protein SCO1/2